MRLWPLVILDQLPRQQLLGQHRECCALRGKGWNRKHATVDYVFKHPYDFLWKYHLVVMQEMQRRGYKVNKLWLDYSWRGKQIGYDWSEEFTRQTYQNVWKAYPEHDEKYIQECIENLARKGVVIDRKGVA